MRGQTRTEACGAGGGGGGGPCALIKVTRHQQLEHHTRLYHPTHCSYVSQRTGDELQLDHTLPHTHTHTQHNNHCECDKFGPAVRRSSLFQLPSAYIYHITLFVLECKQRWFWDDMRRAGGINTQIRRILRRPDL